MNEISAKATVVFKLLVGGEKPGRRPIKLLKRMNRKNVPKYGTNFRPCLPIIASLWLTTKPTNNSAIFRTPKSAAGIAGSCARARAARLRQAKSTTNNALIRAKKVCCWRIACHSWDNKACQVKGRSISELYFSECVMASKKIARMRVENPTANDSPSIWNRENNTVNTPKKMILFKIRKETPALIFPLPASGAKTQRI